MVPGTPPTSTSLGISYSLDLCGLYMSSKATSDVSSHHPNTCTVARLEVSDSGPSGQNLSLFSDPTFYFIGGYVAEADGCVFKLSHSWLLFIIIFIIIIITWNNMYYFYYGMYIIGSGINWQENIRK